MSTIAPSVSTCFVVTKQLSLQWEADQTAYLAVLMKGTYPSN